MAVYNVGILISWICVAPHQRCGARRHARPRGSITLPRVLDWPLVGVGFDILTDSLVRRCATCRFDAGSGMASTYGACVAATPLNRSHHAGRGRGTDERRIGRSVKR